MSQPFSGSPFPGQPFQGQAFSGQPLVVRAGGAPVRIGDVERDQAVSALGDHFAAGRLSREELDERIDQAMLAKFTTDLRPLFADLPVAESPVRGPAPQLRTVPPVVAMLFFLAPLLLIGIMITAIAVGAPWVLWGFIWVFMFSGMWGRGMRHHAHSRQAQPGFRR